ncbi:hypothetical protein L0U85_16510 [Glycomyces sp. L485]|uniref:hypothetical protein n=1 Tax=Glycomyces sp. L485 TaxID=2909235 RepID=UPI001F4B8E42|nr:hypothetical protein [Glycomyces sp. L485]MCH7232442.1 hypothetical protein [Glycomyces sp. L485]
MLFLMWLQRNKKQPLGVFLVVTHGKRQAAADSRVAVSSCEAVLRALLASVATCFARIESRWNAGQYMRALMSDLGQRNGWSIAEWIGHARPDRVQHLLAGAV